MATLSLTGITIGLPVWLFSTSIVKNTVIPQQSNQQPDDNEVVPSPSTSFVSPSSSLSLLGETSDTKSQVAKKKKKGKEKKKKKQIQQRGNKATIALNATYDEKPSIKPHKVQYPCKLCAGDHLLRNCPDIP